jgi:hypothetical protein
MPDWVGVVGTFAVSVILAYGFLRLRCRAVGPPFGPRARFWACLIVVGTAVVSTGVGLVIVAASNHVHAAAFVGIVVPGGLWFTSLPPRGERLSSGRTFAAGLLTRPFSRLYERMGDDMQDWCDTRIRAAAPEPQWIADAATYYYAQVRAGIKYSQAHADLGRWQESITHKIAIVRLISLDTTPARLHESLQTHPATQHLRKDADDDLPRLARRMESDALSELNLFLAYVYRLGYHKLLIYPFRPSAHQPPLRRAEPMAPDNKRRVEPDL